MFSFFDRKKTWNNWLRAGSSLIPEILDFLIPLEHSSISVTSRLLRGGIPDSKLLDYHEIYIDRNDGKIVSLLMIGADSTIAPVFTEESSTPVPPELLKQSAVHRKRYLTIMGLKKDLLRFEYLLKNRNKMSVDYHQLAAPSSEVPSRVSEYLKTKPEFIDHDIRINRAVPADLDMLMPLRKAYELEEVLLNKSHFNEQACRSRFRKTIAERQVFYASFKNSPAATCCINTEGINWYQIGGVYTQPNLRSRGISAALMARTASEAAVDGKNLTLFVKKNNKPALKLYKNCGFSNTGEFRITYAERR